MTEGYDVQAIEGKWQDHWAKHGTYEVDDDDPRPKFYDLCMYPYPSGPIHMGHVRNYTLGDALCRYKTMSGFAVLSPMGWDSFGLPAENAAIADGIHPGIITRRRIATMKTQIQRLGSAYDWRRELSCCEPDYYRWTQWLFLQLHEAGLAYKGKAPVNWCPSCQTVLANEQAEGGVCDRCGTIVVKRDLEQWFFRITRYAQQLLDDLETVDWPERVKVMQRNWIGRSEGVEFDIAINGSDEPIRVFTTRGAGQAAGAGVHRRDELEPGREDRRPTDPRDRDAALLERLAERLQHVAPELRQLVEEQHALIGERHLAGRQARPAADHRGVRQRVVRRPERRPPDEAADRAARRRPRRRRSPRAPPRRRAAAAARGSSAPAASCPSRAARSAAGRARRPARSRAPAAPRAGREPRARSGTARGRAPRRPSGSAVARSAGSSRSPSSIRGGAVGGPRPGRRRMQLDRLGAASSTPARPRSRRRAAPRRRAVARRRRPAARPAARAPRPSAGCPGTGRTSPPSDSSPISASRPAPARTCSEPSRIPTAIARSSDAPALRRSAGARLTVIRRGGWTKPGVAERAANPLARLLQRRVGEPDDREPGQARARRRPRPG